jgi:Carboxypeptidase regulatory-like domain/TonB dependent receptor
MRSVHKEPTVIAMKASLWARCLSPVICLILFTMVAFAQSDRGTITGTVTDPSSAAVANAKVAVRNGDNGSTFNAVTTSTGSFTIPSVPSGKYNVAVSAPGFKTADANGVEVRLDQTVKVDITLEIGQSTETISVTAAADLLKTNNAEQSMNISGEKVNDLPLNFTAGSGAIRNWLTFTYLAPGVSGTGAGSEVNGLPGSNYKIYLEGQDSTSFNDTAWTSTVAAASVEAITEFAIQSSNFSAEFGQVMGGLYNFTTKSGTNQFHGSLYEEWGNEILDASHPYNHLKDKDRKNDYGFSVGGPVWIPKLYNGRNRTFFFFNYERFQNNLASASQTGTLPTAANRQGDFSCSVYVFTTNCTGNTQTLTDKNSGYTFLQGQIFDPANPYTDAQGRVLRLAFPNNTVPQARMDPIALKVQALIPSPVNTQTSLNWIPNLISNTQQAIPSLKIDQDLGDKTKISFYWTRQSTNQIAAADGLPIPLTAARPKIVEGNQYRVNVDRTISPTILAHLGLGFYRFHNPDSSPAAVLNYDVSGQLGLVGSATGVGFPNITGLGGNINGLGPSTADHQTTNLGSITGSLSWNRGQHSFKAGFEFKQESYSDANLQGAEGVYGFSANQTAIPFLGSATVGTGTTGGIGSGYASFLLGDVNSSTVNPAKDTQLRRITEAGYFQDTFKVSAKLTVEIGVRYDRVPLGKELWDRQSEIGLTTPNPNAGNLPGGFIFAGYGAGRCNCEFSKTYNLGFAPRLSVAYQINKNTVIRAGWGVNYAGGDSWAYLNGGYSLNGMGYNSIQASAPSFGLISSRFQDGIQYNPSVLSQLNLNPGVNTVAGQLNTFSAVWGGLYNDPNAGRPARVNNWNIALQRQLSKDMSIEAAYVGNRGVWEQANSLLPLNTITPQVLAAHSLDITNPATQTLLTSQIGSATAIAAGYKIPYAGFPTTATVAQSLRPFPMYNTGIPVEFVDQGNSWYDALQVKFQKRLGHGLDISSNFTHAKTMNLGNSGINGNALNREVQKGLDPADQPFILVSAITYITPRATENKLVRAITGGWTWAAALRYSSGTLIAAPSSANSKYGTYTFASGTPELRVAGQPLFLVDPNCRCIDPNNINQRVLNPAAWQDVSAGQLSPGSRYYSDYRGPHGVSENMNVGRTFRLKERISLNVRAEFFNVFNRTYLPLTGTGALSSGNPAQATNVNSGTGAITGFGYYPIGNTSNLGGQRSGDLVARLRF